MEHADFVLMLCGVASWALGASRLGSAKVDWLQSGLFFFGLTFIV